MKYVVFMVISVFGFIVSAQVDPTVQEAIAKIEKVRRALKISASQSALCQTPISPSCTFEGYCGQLIDKAQDFYLYQDAEGRQIPNLSMSEYLGFSEHCVDVFPQHVVSDPFVDVEQFVDVKAAGGIKQLRRNKERLKKETARTMAVLEDARSHVIKVLEGRKNANNAKQIDSLIARVNAVKYRPIKATGSYTDIILDGCESANAYYRRDANSITVCPQMMNLPEGALFSILAHELGHAIDPCVLQFDFDSKGAKYPKSLRSGVQRKSKTTLPAVPLSQNPFENIISCLQSPQSIAVQVPTKQALLNEINARGVKLRSDIGDASSEDGSVPELTEEAKLMLADQRKHIEENYERFKYCREMSGVGHMQEAFSDWISTQALAEKVSNIQDSSKSRDFAFASESLFYASDCENIQQVAKSKVLGAIEKCPGIQDMLNYLEEENRLSGGKSSHPDPARRINRIYYANTKIQKALGCQGGNDAQECN
ncbi:hypothetical protein [Bdellovibrio bacteriovorus]|nr:hypothetical protein [Bdellovibrio bacteriovorus]